MKHPSLVRTVHTKDRSEVVVGLVLVHIAGVSGVTVAVGVKVKAVGAVVKEKVAGVVAGEEDGVLQEKAAAAGDETTTVWGNVVGIYWSMLLP